MSYLTQSRITKDADIMNRVAACAATEGIEDPEGWAQRNSWALSARPGWVEAYAASASRKTEPPGADEAAITDAMILDAVRKLYAQPAPAESDPTESPA